MGGAWTITRKELLGYFCSPIGYVVLVIFLGLNGYLFGMTNLEPGMEASLRPLFGRFMPLVLLFIMPMLTMRLLSEEFRSGTIETLMTAPINDAAVIAGKFLGALLYYMVLLATTLFYLIPLVRHGTPDWGGVVAGYLGLVLVGALYIAAGLLFSACTSNQIIAVICSFVFLALLAVITDWIAMNVEGTPRFLLQYISVGYQYGDFVRGAISLSSVAYFLTGTFFLLFVSVKVLESRRWR
ncbi:MAG: hypothetical protein HJJLKODD_01740 [Phycisphaerae bacterium]|nr:hypothetical protein [Phycisphaerae bacterium]